MAESGAVADIRIVNPQGLHARPSTLIVRTANGFQARVTLTVGERTADCKSIMEVMMLASPQGTPVRIAAEGAEAVAAVAAIADLFRTGFGES